MDYRLMTRQQGRLKHIRQQQAWEINRTVSRTTDFQGDSIKYVYVQQSRKKAKLRDLATTPIYSGSKTQSMQNYKYDTIPKVYSDRVNVLRVNYRYNDACNQIS